MKCNNIKNRGSISLEACVVVPIFMILMLFIYSFFIVFSAQNSISHALLQSCQSVSLDPYMTENLYVDNTKLPASMGDAIAKLMEGDNLHFMSESTWYKTDNSKNFSEAFVDIITGGFESGNEKVEVKGIASDELNNVVKQRFVGFLTGGDDTAAKKDLDALNVVGGLDGIVFQALVSGDDLYITANYQIEYVFSFQGTAKITMKQTVCSRIWK